MSQGSIDVLNLRGLCKVVCNRVQVVNFILASSQFICECYSKRIDIWHSCRKNKSGTFVYISRCSYGFCSLSNDIFCLLLYAVWNCSACWLLIIVIWWSQWSELIMYHLAESCHTVPPVSHYWFMIHCQCHDRTMCHDVWCRKYVPQLKCRNAVEASFWYFYFATDISIVMPYFV